MATSTPTRRRLTGPMSQRLRTARMALGLTQQDVADQLDISLKTVNNYENPNYAGARKALVVRAWASLCDRQFKELWGTSHQPISRTGWSSETAA